MISKTGNENASSRCDTQVTSPAGKINTRLRVLQFAAVTVDQKYLRLVWSGLGASRATASLEPTAPRSAGFFLFCTQKHFFLRSFRTCDPSGKMTEEFVNLLC